MIACPRGGCTGSGLNIESLLRQMVAMKETERKVIRMCNGQERMGRNQYRSCIGNFRVNVKLEYKKEAAT